ncbi:C-C motif chemokine 27b [Clarias gariepinus]|uniref:C-C motif chemokine 27b n=1 Tax=Clarias gariepinus TaxID=13013 RepID=UPI00234D677E|nr:C-C motif chemokine 27b [Clarias gariepinus]
MQMDFKILLLILCITFASVQGAVPSCCLKTAPMPRRVVVKAKSYTIQNANGHCEIDALVVKIGSESLHMEMDFKILLLVMCITFASVQGAIPRCCLKTAPLYRDLVRRAWYFEIQNTNGPCEIEALVLYFKGNIKIKTACVPLWQKKYLPDWKLKKI